MIYTGPFSSAIRSSPIASDLKGSRMMGFGMIDCVIGYNTATGGPEINPVPFSYSHLKLNYWTRNIYYPGVPYESLNNVVSLISVIAGGKWQVTIGGITNYSNNPFVYSDLGVTPGGSGTRGPGAEKKKIIGRTAGTICWYPPYDIGYTMSPDCSDGGDYWHRAPTTYRQITPINSVGFELIPMGSP